jgi:hypothetical protein
MVTPVTIGGERHAKLVFAIYATLVGEYVIVVDKSA